MASREMVPTSNAWTLHYKLISGRAHFDGGKRAPTTSTSQRFAAVPAVPPCSSESLPFTEIPVVEPARTHTLVTRCCALLDCLSSMIREELSGAVTVPLQDSIHMLDLILSVTDHSLMNVVSVELVLLKTSLPVLHASAIELLTALVCRCGTDLLPHGSTLVKLLVQELTWTSCKDTRYGQQRPFGQLRLSVYTCLKNWVQRTGCLPLDINNISKLFQQIMQDVQPQSSQTKLLPSSDSEHQKSKKAKKRKLQEDVGQLLTGQQKVNKHANEALTCRALGALSTILIGAGADIPVDIYQQLQIFVLKLVMQCQQSQHNLYPIPYSSGECRHALYHALLSCLLTHPPQVPSAIHHAVRLFSLGLQDNELKVSSFCREALAISMALIHPRVPPQVSSAAGTLTGSNLEQVSNNDPLPPLAPVNQFVAVNQFSAGNQLTGTGPSEKASHHMASVNGNNHVELAHDDQTVQDGGNAQHEQKSSEEPLNSGALQDIPSTSTNVADSYTTNTTETPAEINDNQFETQKVISLNEHEEGASLKPVWDSQSICASFDEDKSTEHDLVQSSTHATELATGDASLEDERPGIAMDTDSEALSECDEVSEVEKILQCFVDSHPDSE